MQLHASYLITEALLTLLMVYLDQGLAVLVSSASVDQVVTFFLQLCSSSQCWACSSATSCFLLILFLQSSSPLFFNKATLWGEELGYKSKHHKKESQNQKKQLKYSVPVIRKSS